MGMQMDEVITEKDFIEFLTDAISFAFKALQSDGPFVARYARASILNSMLSLECCANILLDGIEGKDFRKDADRLPFPSKFDLFARISVGNTLNRGRKELQSIQELKVWRDKIVHRKAGNRLRVTLDKPENEKLIPKQNGILKLGDTTAFWDGDTAIRVLRALSDFFNYYFQEVLKHDRNKTFLLLSTQFDIPGHYKGVVLTPADTDYWVKKISKFDISFDCVVAVAKKKYNKKTKATYGHRRNKI